MEHAIKTIERMSTMPKLENWSIIEHESNPFIAPELRSKSLMGEIYNHDRFEDGTEISTSSIQELNLEDKYAVTRNTTYELGEPSDFYIEWLNKNNKSLNDYINYIN